MPFPFGGLVATRQPRAEWVYDLEMEFFGQMSCADLKVSIVEVLGTELRGNVVDQDGGLAFVWAGMDVTVFVNPPHTAFDDPAILGGGRVYENRVEIDLMLPIERAATLIDGLRGRSLHFRTAAITETLFRVQSADLG